MREIACNCAPLSSFMQSHGDQVVFCGSSLRYHGDQCSHRVLFVLLFGAVALKVLQKKCERRHMIPVCTWRTAGEKVHLSETCGGQGPRDFWSIPRKHKKFVKVEWCKKCAKEYMV